MTATPGHADSARTIDVAEPAIAADEVLVQSVLVGLCGSDRELLHRRVDDGAPLVVGHESLGRVLRSPAGSRLTPGDLVVGMIRRPCAEGCPACLAGRLDQCSTQPPTERGLFRLDGFGTDRWTAPESFLIPAPATLGERAVLTEPASCIVKAERRVRALSAHAPASVLVVGSGTIGILAAWIFGRDADRVVVVSRSPTPAVDAVIARLPSTVRVRSAPASERFDLVIEASGSPEGAQLASEAVVAGGTVVLLGVYPDANPDPGLLRRVVLRDLLVVGSANASRDDHVRTVELLAAAPAGLLEAIVGEPITPEEWPAWVAARSRASIKTVVRFADADASR